MQLLRHFSVRAVELLFQQRINKYVDATQEKARDRSDAFDGFAALDPALDAAQVRFGDFTIARQPEQERDVDVDALADELFDSGQTFLGGRHLDEDVRSIERPPQRTRFFDGCIGVAREMRRYFEAHEAVAAVAFVVEVPQPVGRGLHVVDGQRLVDFGDRLPGAGERVDAFVVVVTAADGLLENARV